MSSKLCTLKSKPHICNMFVTNAYYIETPYANDLAVILRDFYGVSIKSFRNSHKRIFALISMITLSYFLGVILSVLTWRLKKMYSAKVTINSDNYLGYRNELDLVKSYIERITINENLLKKNNSFFLKPIVKSLLAFNELLILRRDNIIEAINIIQVNDYSSNSFKLVTEEKVWNNRPKCAEFLFK